MFLFLWNYLDHDFIIRKKLHQLGTTALDFYLWADFSLCKLHYDYRAE